MHRTSGLDESHVTVEMGFASRVTILEANHVGELPAIQVGRFVRIVLIPAHTSCLYCSIFRICFD